MKKLAICIPTYNRKEVVEDILDKINNAFEKNETDIFIYDSSEDNIDYKYSMEESSVRVYQKKLDSNVHSNEKVYIIYQTKEIIEEYEYIWILPDYMFYSDKVIKDIKEALNETNDYILINYWNSEKKDNYICKDINYVFNTYAALLTQFGTIIVNSIVFSEKSMVHTLADKYLRVDRINFSQVGLYFEIMSKYNDLKIKVIECEKKDYYKSSVKKLYISKDNLEEKKNTKWETAFHVWAVCWPETVKALPDVYKNKWEVVKSEVAKADILDERFLISQRSIGATKLWIVLKNCIRWKYISNTNFVKTIFICLMPKKYAAWCTYNRSLMWKRKISNNIKKLRRISDNKDIYVYGAGKRADEYVKILEENDIRIKALVVTDAKLFSGKTYGYDVIGIERLKEVDNDYIIILALNEGNKNMVYGILKQSGMDKYVYDERISVW